ncbi:hypothetical protein GCM10009838_21540 [Catenulispora subtropica]|uniref:Uncharacterized protein n=1 Tax=Catenulispora subtropica TaxID=450798 RepID=A0ABN2R644_9ACTN
MGYRPAVLSAAGGAGSGYLGWGVRTRRCLSSGENLLETGGGTPVASDLARAGGYSPRRPRAVDDIVIESCGTSPRSRVLTSWRAAVAGLPDPGVAIIPAASPLWVVGKVV